MCSPTSAHTARSTHWPSWSQAPFWCGWPKSPTTIGPSTALTIWPSVICSGTAGEDVPAARRPAWNGRGRRPSAPAGSAPDRAEEGPSARRCRGPTSVRRLRGGRGRATHGLRSPRVSKPSPLSSYGDEHAGSAGRCATMSKCRPTGAPRRRRRGARWPSHWRPSQSSRPGAGTPRRLCPHAGNVAGVSNTEIVVGGVASLTGPIPADFAPIFDGVRAYLNDGQRRGRRRRAQDRVPIPTRRRLERLAEHRPGADPGRAGPRLRGRRRGDPELRGRELPRVERRARPSATPSAPTGRTARACSAPRAPTSPSRARAPSPPTSPSSCTRRRSGSSPTT